MERKKKIPAQMTLPVAMTKALCSLLMTKGTRHIPMLHPNSNTSQPLLHLPTALQGDERPGLRVLVCC